MIGETISHYRILERLGEGGMGVVTRPRTPASDGPSPPSSSPPHLTRDPEARERFEREARTVRQLPTYAHKEAAHSSYGRCAKCVHLDRCAVCPVSIGHVEGNADPHRVPDFVCAFNRVSLGYRERFPRRPGLLQRILGEPYPEEREWWGNVARAARTARS